MRKKVITSAVIILILSIILLLINHYKGHNSIAAPEITLVYAENQVEDYPTTKGAYEFARLVNERTNGRIKIVVKCNGELGDEKSVIEQLKFGGIDFSRVSISSISDDIPALKVIQMPFLYSDAQEMLDVLNGKEGMQFVDAVRESNLGVRALSWYDAGARSFYSVKPVTAIQDLQGLNIRVQESELMSETIEMLGANPVKMTYSEVYKGLQTGKIDGAENSLVTYTYSKHYEQAKYCLIDEHTRIPEVQLISRYTWDKLSDEDRAIISECAKESAVYERDIWKNTEEAAVKTIEDKDITVTKVSDEEKQNLREKLQPIYDKYCSNYIDIIKEIEKNQE